MKTKTLRETATNEMLDAIPKDISNLTIVRGKHYQKMRHGYSIHVETSDDHVTVQHVKPDETLIALAPDVRAYFPTSEAVNQALRALITVIEQTPHKDKPRAKRRAKPVAA